VEGEIRKYSLNRKYAFPWTDIQETYAYSTALGIVPLYLTAHKLIKEYRNHGQKNRVHPFSKYGFQCTGFHETQTG
jgi:hypothetical protein